MLCLQLLYCSSKELRQITFSAFQQSRGPKTSWRHDDVIVYLQLPTGDVIVDFGSLRILCSRTSSLLRALTKYPFVPINSQWDFSPLEKVVALLFGRNWGKLLLWLLFSVLPSWLNRIQPRLNCLFGINTNKPKLLKYFFGFDLWSSHGNLRRSGGSKVKSVIVVKHPVSKRTSPASTNLQGVIEVDFPRIHPMESSWPTKGITEISTRSE